MERNNLNVMVLLPILPVLRKHELIRCLLELTRGLFKEGPTADTFAENVVRMIGPNLTASELLVSLHTCDIAQRDQRIAIELCVTRLTSTLFTADVVLSALQRMVDLPTLPRTIMLTILLTARNAAYGSLIVYLNTQILRKLIQRQFWEQNDLWKGFVSHYIPVSLHTGLNCWL